MYEDLSLDPISSSNNTEYPYDKQKTIHQLIEEQAARTPEAVAAVFHRDEITYKELNGRANQLARKLRERGIKANDIVGLMVGRSIDMLTGMLGIMKAGGCYLPLDPKFPAARIAYMLKDSQARLLLTESGIQTDAESDRVLFIDRELSGDIGSRGEPGNYENIENINSGSDLLYVIYTSGSTGTPKGVMIEHWNVHNFIEGMKQRIDFSEHKVMLSLTTISFDIFVLESLLPLTLGMKIVIADPMTFAEDMAGQSVHMLQTTPSTIRMILNDERNHPFLHGVTDVILGGEPFPAKLLEWLKSLDFLHNTRLYNVYGPTETTVWSTIKELTDTDRITIGRPIANTRIYIMDEAHHPVCAGETGEICIAGDGVVRGYLFRPELTAARFITVSAEGEDTRMYCTGDLGSWLPGGELECLGRIDSQVKIRGFRIELGEIEAALLGAEGIENCVVDARENEQGEKYLAAYYVSARPLVISDLITWLKGLLPEYEIPGIYMRIEQIPLTPNGKADRLSLPEPQFKRPELHTPYQEPKSAGERELVRIWKQILNLDRVGILDNFFDLGGNSVLVSQLLMTLEKKYGVSLDVADLFSLVTIRQQSELLKEKVRLKDAESGGERQLLPILFQDFWYPDSDRLSDRIIALSLPVDEKMREEIDGFAASVHCSPECLCLGAYLYLLDQHGLAYSEEVPVIHILAFDPSLTAAVRMSRPVSDDLEMLAMMIGERRTRILPAGRLASPVRDFGSSNSRERFLTFYYDEEAESGEIAGQELLLGLTETSLMMRFREGSFREEEISGLLGRYKALLLAISKWRQQT